MADISVTTSQNVNVSFTPASVGSRILAFIVDSLIKVAFLVIIFYIFVKLFNITRYFDGLDQWSVGTIVLLLTFPIYIYTLVFEALMEGQTPGKKLLNIKVIKLDGYQANFGDYLIRWFFRLVDIFTNSGAVGIISMIVSKNNQRLGDLASGTAVISLKSDVNINHTILENIGENYIPAFPQVIALNDNDVRIIKENYKKALVVDDRALMTRLSNKIKETLHLEIDPKEYTERKFIDKVLKDYNFYTGQDN